MEETMEPILVATPKFVDFGEVHFAPKVHSAIATIVLTNKSAFDTIVVQVGEADSTQVDYPVNVRVVPEEFDVTKSLFVFSEKSEGEQVVLLPGLSKSCKVMFYSSSKLDSGHLRTSFFKVSSSIFLPYYVQRGERPENLSLVIPYSASLCTSILFTEDTELLFENCELDREYSRNIQIWNRSESVLSYSVTFHDNLEDFGTNEVSFYEQESEEIIRIGSSYSIEPFASKRLSIRMLAKAIGNFRFSFVLQNDYNPANAVRINGIVSIEERQQKSEMDNLHNNVSKLWLMDYQVDKVSEAEALATSGDELKLMGSAVVCYQLHDSVPTILELGDSYDGSIKVKHFWFSNDSDSCVTTVFLQCEKFKEEVLFEMGSSTDRELEEYLSYETLGNRLAGVSSDNETKMIDLPVDITATPKQHDSIQSRAGIAVASKLEEKVQDDDAKARGSNIKGLTTSLQSFVLATIAEEVMKSDKDLAFTATGFEDKGNECVENVSEIDLEKRTQNLFLLSTKSATSNQKDSSKPSNVARNRRFNEYATQDYDVGVITWDTIQSRRKSNQGKNATSLPSAAVGKDVTEKRRSSTTFSSSSDLGIICSRTWAGEGFKILDRNEEALYRSRPFVGQISESVRHLKAGTVSKNSQYVTTRRIENKYPSKIGEAVTGISNHAQSSSDKKEDEVISVISDSEKISSINHQNSGDECDNAVQDSVVEKERGIEFSLLPKEKRIVTVVVKTVVPSELRSLVDSRVGGSSSVAVGGMLIARKTDVIIHWKERQLMKVETDPVFQSDHSNSTVLSFNYRVCESLISVSPKLCDFGLNNVGESAATTITVLNKCDLPTVVYSYIESDAIFVIEKQLFIPQKSSRQIHLEFFPSVEMSNYQRQLRICNARNLENIETVAISAKSVDANQTHIHSLFYKVITYNNKRQTQIFFDRCLYNMPNARTFSIKNVYKSQIRLQLITKSKSKIKIMLISEGELFAKYEDSDDKIVSKSIKQRTMDEDLEDLKWGTLLKDTDRMEGNLKLKNKASRTTSRLGLDDITRASKITRHSFSSGVEALDIGTSSLGATGGTSETLSVVYQKNPATTVNSPNKDRSVSLDKAGTEHSGAIKNDSDEHLTSVLALEKPKLLQSALPKNSDNFVKATIHAGDIVSRIVKESFPFKEIDCYLDEEQDDSSVDYSNVKENAVTAVRVPEYSDVSGIKSTRNSMVTPAVAKRERTLPINLRKADLSQLEQGITQIQRLYNNLETMINNISVSPHSSSIRELSEEIISVHPTNFHEIGFSDSMSSPGMVGIVDATKAEEVQDPTLLEEAVAATVEIPVGQSFTFLLLYRPLSTSDDDDCYFNDISETMYIKLLGIGPQDVEELLASNQPTNVSTLTSRQALATLRSSVDGSAYALKARSLLIGGTIIKSEMIVIQKNINFGRTLVGDVSTRSVTVVNRSTVPCIYSIAKSGSISSGFLHIPEGRKGIIPAMSTKSVEFIFKPSLPGSFEENLQIENLLNPRNSHTVVIKAKVSKAASFLLLPLGSSVLNGALVTETVQGSRGESATQATSTTTADRLSTSVPVPIELSTAELLNEPKHIENAKWFSTYFQSERKVELIDGKADTSAMTTMNTEVAPTYLGTVAVGERCIMSIRFRMKNTTSKTRQFIVDASHLDVCSMFLSDYKQSNTNSEREIDDSSLKIPQDESVIENNFSQLYAQIQENPDMLNSLISLRCHFHVESSRQAQESESLLSETEREKLEDNLEHYQQKLKIALRKHKSDKITKYQKKIQDTIDILSGVKILESAASTGEAIFQNAESTGDTADSSCDVKEKVLKIQESEVISGATPSTEESKMKQKKLDLIDEATEHSFQLFLMPEEEKTIAIYFSIVPGTCYQAWEGGIPFVGYLRCFESKNEDSVKKVWFGATVFSSRLAFVSCKSVDRISTECNDLESSPFVAANDDSMPVTETNTKTSMDNSFANVGVDVSNVGYTFIVTLAQWSSFATKQFAPRFKEDFHSCMSGMSLKLVQVGKELVQHGSLSVASLLGINATVVLAVDESFFQVCANSPIDFIPYDSRQHGLVSISASTASQRSKVPAPSPMQLARATEDFVDPSMASFQSDIEGGSKMTFNVQWRPSDSLETVQIVGVIAVQLKLGSKVIGKTQYIPFVSRLGLPSIFTVERSLNCGDVASGISKGFTFHISNLSEHEDLHYIVISEEVASGTRALGKIERMIGQTGLVGTGQTKSISFHLSAISPGRFEQKLWIRNIRQSFDQKRILIQANVTLSQSKYVNLMDLESNPDENGKFKTLDLGLIQIKNHVNSEEIDDSTLLLPPELLMSINKANYRLRIQNVSETNLYLTATSNLKSQCNVYVDDKLEKLAVNILIEPSCIAVLHIVVRPVSLQKIQQSSKPFIDTTTVLSQNVDTESMRSSKASGEAGKDSKSSFPTSASGRELIGGIKLIFHTDDGKSEGNVAAGSAQLKKLFESAVSFRAIVGKSKLRGTTVGYPLLYAKVDGNRRVIENSFELKNGSQVFPLRYHYLYPLQMKKLSYLSTGIFYNNNSRIIFGERSLEDSTEISSHGVTLHVLDEMSGSLAPGESRFVQYRLYYQSASGLVNIDLKLLNIDTMKLCVIPVQIFLDAGQLWFAARISDIRDHAKEMKPLHEPAKLEQISWKGEMWDKIMTEEPTAVASKFPIFLKNVDLTACTGAEDYTAVEPNSSLEKSSNHSVEKRKFEIVGGIRRHLCDWILYNQEETTLNLLPISDLPILVSTSNVSWTEIHENSESPGSVSRITETKRQVNLFSKKITDEANASVLVPGGYNRCGPLFSLEGRSAVRIVVAIKRGQELNPNFVNKLGGSLRVNSGSLCNLVGQVAYMNVTGKDLMQTSTLFLEQSDDEENQYNLSVDTESKLDSASSKIAVHNLVSVDPIGIVGLTRVESSVVCPTISLSCGSVHVGSLRSGYEKEIEILISNLSEADVSFGLENLPSWLRLADSMLDLSSKEEISSLGNLDQVRKLDSTKRVQWSLLANRTTHLESYDVMVDSNVSDSSGAALELNETDRKNSLVESVDANGSDSNLWELGSGRSSLEVQQDNYSVAFSDIDAGSSVAELEGSSAVDTYLRKKDAKMNRQFVVTAKSDFVVKMIVRAPYVDSQKLEHSIRVSSLAAIVGGSNKSREIASGVAEISFILDVDSTKAVELIPVESKRAIFRKTYYRDHHKSIYSTLKTLDNTLKDTSKELRVGRYSTAHKATFAPPTSIYTVLKTAVKVPPDVSVNLSRCQNSNWDDQNVVLMGEPYLQHFADDVRIIPDKQAIYTFMIKNKLKSRISVDVSLQPNTAVEDLIGMKVQLSSRGKAVELMIEETVEIRVAVLSKLSSRLQPELDKVNKYEVSNKDMKQLVDKNSLVQLSELADDKLETATLSMMKDISTQSGNVLEDIEDFNNEDSKKELDESSVNLLGLTIDGDQTLPVEYGPILFGTVCFRCCVIAPDDVLKPTVLSDDGATASVILNTEAKLEQLHHSQNTPEITAPQDVIFLDLVGYLQAGPTVAVSPILPLIVEHSVDTTTSNEVNLRSGMRRDVLELLASTDKANKVRERIDDAVIFHAVRASSRTSPFYPTLSNDANPVLELEEYEQQFYLHNPSEIHTLNFTIESSSYRLAGMQLALYDSTHVAAVNGSDRGVYDTITISTVPNHGVIPPHSSIIVKAMLIPGAVADANKVYPIEHSIRRGDLYLLSKMSILIKDNSWPSQPPRQMTVVLSSSTPIQRFMTQPVSATNRSKKTSLRSSDRDSKLSSVILNNQNDGGEISKAVLEIGDGRKNASQLEEVKERDRFQFNSADPSADSATIRLRGLTPHSTLQGRYTIDLGLQSQKKEFLEWLITLENNSMSHPTIVKVMLGAQEDKSWLTVGQTKSFIAEGDSVSVMLYFNRATIGIFSGYVIVENTEKLLDRQIIRVQMTVASLSSNITTSNGVPSVGTILSGDAPNVDRSNKSRLRPVLKLSLDSMETFDDTVEAVIDTADAKSFPSAQLLDDSALLFAQKLVGFTLTISSLVDFDLEVVVLLTVHNQYAERFRLSLANNSGVIETSKGSNRLGGINNLSCKLHSRDYCKFSVVVEDLYHENLDDRDGDLLNSADNNLALDTFKPINKRSSDDVPSEMQKTAIGMISIECRQFEDQNRSISLLWIG